MEEKDKILSILDASNLKYKEGDFLEIVNNEKNNNIFYRDGIFFIKTIQNNDIPHINNFDAVPHFFRKSRTKYNGYSELCLTRDKTFRDRSFDPFEKLERAFDIVNEKYEDPTLERFKEIEFTIFRQLNLGTSKRWKLFNGTLSLSNASNTFKEKELPLKKIDFTGQTQKDLKKILKENCLVEISYKNHIKKFVWFEKKFYYLEIHDKSHLFGRTGTLDRIDGFEKILIVGLGSIGSYLLSFLVKNGIDNIEIYDADKVSLVNYPRFAFWKPSNINLPNESKVKIATDFIKNTFPHLKVSYTQKDFLPSDIRKYKEKSILIINTTGGSSEQRNKIFNKILNSKKDIKILDIFIEAYGCAMHSIILDKNSKEVLDAKIWFERSISNPEKDFRTTFDNCMIATLPYSNGPILVGIPILVDELIKVNFANGHYTLPMIKLSKIKKDLLNKNLNKELKDYKVYKWK